MKVTYKIIKEDSMDVETLQNVICIQQMDDDVYTPKSVLITKSKTVIVQTKHIITVLD